MDLNGRVAIVTGGGGGLGAATVRHLIGVGMKVVVVDKFGDAAEAVAKEFDESVAVAVAGDTTVDEDVEAAIAAGKALGTVSLLVNVAGGATGGGRTVGKGNTPHDKDVFVTTLAMNVTGTFNFSRLVAAGAFADNEPDEFGQRGVIINVGSLAGLEGQTGQIAYGSAKAAVLGMTLPMARDLSVIGVRVCGIAPGTMGTPKMESIRPEMLAALTKDIVFPKRLGRPEEFALLVESIARNPYLNGENIRLDGALRFPAK
ncbi:SDR family NAD(P)-dependent oxidoreductase [Frankia sp. AgB1.9]|uniref:SDR family NAD(P)-dependent oxidoreductase n=1 Tax=unclassified Frankia TaxID=2632575 RepID=UPI001933C888|nr:MULTISPECIES: SDR family NAD(P)-dependent oxidoreductase [unclassified Frankia]MBL7488276.1 SDR family NAD(P)-dependent oxidoreductase [Frankia sp. AgW1.1]MBL7548081.1 SDR family NAD(P)-dependent oxidoreductase [Frankia sp. AgB1.9]MBL7620307.1 SDR family NAD(P)-dependent oxidoreductase [Frankia sp. AgB1.8]